MILFWSTDECSTVQVPACVGISDFFFPDKVFLLLRWPFVSLLLQQLCSQLFILEALKFTD